MKHLNVDWQALAAHLPLWRSLSPAGQRGLLRLKSNQQLKRDALDGDQPEQLVAAGLMGFSADQVRLRITDGGREFFKAMRAMDRHPLSSDSGARELRAYIDEHLTTTERAALLDDAKASMFPRREKFDYDRVAQTAWAETFLELSSLKAGRAWERNRLPVEPVGDRYRDGSPFFDSQASFEATQNLVRELMDAGEPMPLDELPQLDPGASGSEASGGRAVMAAVRYLLLFPRLEDDGAGGAVPSIGPWPQVAYLMHRPDAVAPDPIEPEETFHAPFLAEDMTTVLVTASAEPLRVLASGQGLYKKDLQRLTAALMALPPWLYDPPEDPEAPDQTGAEDPAASTAESRVDAAIQACLSHELLTIRENSKGHIYQEVTDAGQTWLGRPMPQRLGTVVAPWRPTGESKKAKKKSEKKARRSTLKMLIGGELVSPDDRAELSPWTPPQMRWSFDRDAEKVDWVGAWRDALARAQDEGGEDGFRELEPLLLYHGRVNNPLLGRRAHGDYGPRPRLDRFGIRDRGDELHLERVWAGMLADTIFAELIPRGAVEAGWDGDRLAIRLTDIGRYMLGLADDFDYRAQAEGQVIVQPNFEVAFMGPAPAAEATLGRLAERTGRRMGAMFRITRASVLAAAAAGIGRDDALRDLERVSAKPLPANVRREVAGWFDSTRTVQMRQTWILDAPDEETARRALTTAGKQARRLTPTLIEVTTKSASHTALVRKLKKAGVFVR